MINKIRTQKNKPPPRPYTSLTIYLVQKWHREGMTTPAIGKLLNRTPHQIRELLDIPLAREDYAKMGEYRGGGRQQKYKPMR